MIKWISVKDRLPENIGSVLVWVPSIKWLTIGYYPDDDGRFEDAR